MTRWWRPGSCARWPRASSTSDLNYLRDSSTARLAQHMADQVDTLGEGLTDDPVVAARVLREGAESFLHFGIVARREAEQQDELKGAPDILVTVPFFDADIFDMEGLIRLG